MIVITFVASRGSTLLHCVLFVNTISELCDQGEQCIGRKDIAQMTEPQ